MAELISEWISTGGLQGETLNAYVNVLTGSSAAAQATSAAGGEIDTGADFRQHTIPIISGLALPTKVNEAGDKPTDEATPGAATLSVDMWAKFHQISRQMESTRAASDILAKIMNATVGMFPIAYDIEVLAAAAAGANNNADVEYVASAPITSISSLLAPYDETAYEADAVVLTRAGARKLGFAVDGEGRLQSNTGAQGLFGDLPVFVTKATGTQLGVATLMGVVGPFGAGTWATADAVSVERMPQATVDGLGPEQNIVNYRIEGAFGYANGVDYDGTGRGFTPLIDAA